MLNQTSEPSEPRTDFRLLVDHLKRLIDDEAVPGDPPQEAHHDEHLRRRQEDEALPVLVEAPMFFSNYVFSNFWLPFGKLREARSRRDRRQKFASKSSRSTRFTLMRLWEKRTESKMK